MLPRTQSQVEKKVKSWKPSLILTLTVRQGRRESTMKHRSVLILLFPRTGLCTAQCNCVKNFPTLLKSFRKFMAKPCTEARSPDA